MTVKGENFVQQNLKVKLNGQEQSFTLVNGVRIELKIAEGLILGQHELSIVTEDLLQNQIEHSLATFDVKEHQIFTL